MDKKDKDKDNMIKENERDEIEKDFEPEVESKIKDSQGGEDKKKITKKNLKKNVENLASK